MFEHIPVLPQEVLDNFGTLQKGSLIMDGTLGKGGHSKLLLENGFHVVGVDRDKDAIKEATENLKKFENVRIVHNNFSKIKQIRKDLGIQKFDGILLDTGVSTYQLQDSKRGFGFDGDLDMRMNQEQKLTAKDIVNNYPEKKLANILFVNGERVNARNIAKKIVEYRKDHKIETGGQLLKLVKYSMDERYRKTRKHHWATPTFRALRIEVNKDYENIEYFFKDFTSCLRKGGILEIITFHSIEEKIVKNKLKELKQKNKIKLITKKPILGTRKEISKNPKTKRAKLWVAEMK